MNAFILDLNGILFAVQLACLLLIGPYADYGNWRPWLLIGALSHLSTPGCSH